MVNAEALLAGRAALSRIDAAHNKQHDVSRPPAKPPRRPSALDNRPDLDIFAKNGLAPVLDSPLPQPFSNMLSDLLSPDSDDSAEDNCDSIYGSSTKDSASNSLVGDQFLPMKPLDSPAESTGDFSRTSSQQSKRSFDSFSSQDVDASALPGAKRTCFEQAEHGGDPSSGMMTRIAAAVLDASASRADVFAQDPGPHAYGQGAGYSFGDMTFVATESTGDQADTGEKPFIQHAMPSSRSRQQIHVKPSARPIEQQIELTRKMCTKSDEILKLISTRTAPLTAKEARKSRLVEGFRLETLTSALATTQRRQSRRAPTAGPSERNLRVSGLSVPLNCQLERCARGAQYDFFVVLSVGTQVACTDIVSIKYGDPQSALVFENEFVFEGVKHDFALDMQLYGCEVDSAATKPAPPVLKSQKTLGKILSHVTPMKRNKRAQKAALKASKTPKAARPYAGAVGAGASAFQFEKMGTASLTLGSLHAASHELTWLSEKLQLMPLKPQLEITASISAPEAEAELQGGLTYSHGRGRWVRYWCTLQGGTLRFWSRKEDSEMDIISGHTLVVTKDTVDAQVVKRSECARANCISVDGCVFDSKPKTVRLACDSRAERTAWLQRLRGAITEVKAWGAAP